MSNDTEANGGIQLVCGDCGHSETAHVGPTIHIGGDIDVTVARVSCSKCGYEGEPGETDD